MQQSSIAEYLAPEAHEQGVQQGIQRGLRESARKHILEALAIRLQPDVAETFKLRLDAIDDLQRLDQLHRAAILAESPEDFMQVLNESAN